MPINLISITAVNEAARVEALVNKGIPIHDERVTLGHPNFEPDLFEEVHAERKRIIQGWIETSNIRATAFTVGADMMNAIIDDNAASAWDAVQATMAAMLIGLWTAFESLAQDTWINAVNLRPIPLAERVLEPSAQLETGMQLKALSMKEICRAHFNLTGMMGDLLLRQRAVDFQSLKTTRAAYKVAFADELEPIFEAFHTDLYRLETLRNLFVHKGGIVDKKFISRMGNDQFSKDTEGRSLSVNGQYVAAKANAVAHCSTKLIQAVDKWLEDHPVGDEPEAIQE
jgi:hypothetical protein